jgi:hypothetical protein
MAGTAAESISILVRVLSIRFHRECTAICTTTGTAVSIEDVLVVK